MDWQHPEALYLILPICAIWGLLAFHSNRRRRLAREAFVAAAMQNRILPEQSPWRFFTKLLLRELAIIAGLVALAGPRFGTVYEMVVPRGADLYVMIDVSRSMLADDVKPSRLGRAKADVSSLLNRLEGERIGLIAFAGQAVVKCPLTVDYDSFRRSLDELDPESAPRGGTAIGDAIRKGLEVFQARSDRDQAIILITDGDDQQSYPLEAAAVASERHVTIFTIGLGDSEQGARIPQKESPNLYIEHEGQQVWSKLDNSLLEQIALKTSGVYVPAGTRSYDLGELYAKHLQGRRGSDQESQRKVRHSERFQPFLALSLLLLLIDQCISLYGKGPQLPQIDLETQTPASRNRSRRAKPANAMIGLCCLLWLQSWSRVGTATEPTAAVQEGLRLYAREEYGEALSQFSAAREALEQKKSADVALAAYDEACAAHRKGEFEQAREAYLRAGLSPDPEVATSAHFNLGTLSAEKARQLCGEKPELVEVEQRKEILDHLFHAVAAYRHCLEIQSDHRQARRNLELVRAWIKYYSDRWAELDRQKRRDESNLLSFLEFLMQTQAGLRENLMRLPEPVSSNELAELKRAQDQLREEIPTLKDKIESEIQPDPAAQSGTAAKPSNEEEEAIQLLKSWADTASEKMASASRRLGGKDLEKASADQQAAFDELDRIWDGIIPFHPLLNKELAEQTAIAQMLKINEPEPDTPNESNQTEDAQSIPLVDAKQHDQTSSAVDQQQSNQGAIVEDNLPELEQRQLKALNKARLLLPKAESELSQLEQQPATGNAASEQAGENDEDASGSTTGKEDPSATDLKAVKEGYRTAITLAPDAVAEMERAIESLKQRDRKSAAKQAEEAQRILKKIQEAQPQKKQDPQNQNSQDQQQQQNGDQEQQPDQQPEEQKGADESEQQDSSDDKSERNDQKPHDQATQDRIEDALRKVRERQQEKRERDRKMKRLYQRNPVDKDW